MYFNIAFNENTLVCYIAVVGRIKYNLRYGHNHILILIKYTKEKRFFIRQLNIEHEHEIKMLGKSLAKIKFVHL